MLQLILMIRQSRKVDVEDLKFDKKSPDYPKIDISNYILAKIFEKDVIWKVAVSRKADNALFTDLMNPYPSSICPACKEIIPLIDFKNKKCSSCGAALSGIDPTEIDNEKDGDGDGISDIREKELGMNPNDPNDVYSDLDNDGFSNAFEVKNGTNIKDPKSHPSTINRLYVEKIERKKLRFVLKKIVKKGDSKLSWDIYTSEYLPEKGRDDDKFRKIGNEIIIDGTLYKILDIVPKESEKLDPKTNSKILVDESEIIIQSKEETPIHVKLKSSAYENKETIYVVDAFTKQRFKLLLGEKFSVPTPAAGDEETYLVSKIISRDELILELDMTGSDKKLEIKSTPNELLKAKEEGPKPNMEVPGFENINF